MRVTRHWPLLLLGILPWSAPSRADVARVALEENGFAPFYFREAEHREGIYEKILTRIARLSGDEFKIIYVPQNRKLHMFELNEVDVEPGVNPAWREEAANISVYTEPFMVGEDVLIYNSGDGRVYGKPEDLKGRTLGCFTGFSYPLLAPLFTAGTVERDDSPDTETIVRKLTRHRIDAAVLFRTVAEYFLKTHPETRFAFGAVIGSAPVMFRFQATKAAMVKRFDQALEAMKKSGELKAIFAAFR